MAYYLLLPDFGTSSADHTEDVSGGEVRADCLQDLTSGKSGVTVIHLRCALRLDPGSETMQAPGGELSDGFACAGGPSWKRKISSFKRNERYYALFLMTGRAQEQKKKTFWKPCITRIFARWKPSITFILILVRLDDPKSL